MGNISLFYFDQWSMLHPDTGAPGFVDAALNDFQ
jgi:hypothetical protein